MISKTVPFLIAFFFLITSQAADKVYFKEPKNNSVVTKTFKMIFAQKGLKIKPAGEDSDNKKAGHFHVIVDSAFTPEGEVVAADATHIHYGKGQTEALLTLPPGKHVLTLQFADGAHRSSGPALAETINITVK